MTPAPRRRLALPRPPALLAASLLTLAACGGADGEAARGAGKGAAAGTDPAGAAPAAPRQ